MRIILPLLSIVLFFNSAFAQLPVSTLPQNKKVVLEMYKGNYDMFSSRSDTATKFIKSKNPRDISIINYYSGTFADANFTTTVGDELHSEWNISYSPSGTVNRDTFNGIFISAYNNWDSISDILLSQTSYVNIACEATIDTSTRLLTLDLTSYFTDAIAPNEIYLNVVITQDSIIGIQAGGSTYNPAQALPNDYYVHLDVFRHSLTGVWGDTITKTSQGTLIQKQYNWTMPLDINGIPLDISNIKVVAYITESKTNIITSCHWPQLPCANFSNFSYIDNGNGNYDFTNTSIGSFNKVHWAFGDGSTSTLNNPNHTFAADGPYDVVLGIIDTNEVNCFSYNYNPINVTSVPSSVPCNAGYSTYLDTTTYDIIVVNSSTGNNVTYYWDFGDGTIDSMGYPSHTYTTLGPHYLCLTVDDGAGCVDTYCDSIGIYGIFPKKSGFNINVRPPGTITTVESKKTLTRLTIYPNPTTGSINIDLGETLTKVKTTLTNGLGQVIFEKEYSPTNFISLAIDAPKGIYFLQLQTQNGKTITKKIVKE